jgi:hypothetical protein
MKPTMKRLLLSFGITIAFLSAGCDSQAGATDDAAQVKTIALAQAPTNAPLAEDRAALLDLAFVTASAIPMKPHVKDRSRMQELVVTTCLELDQPERALAYAGQIEDWRRGAAIADYAFYCAQHGFRTEAAKHLEQAAEIAAMEQDWRRDTIKVKIAQTYLWLNEPKRAAEFDAGLTDSETGKSHAARAQIIGEELFTAQVEALDVLVATEVFDQVRNALDAFAELFNHFYDDADKRSLAEQRIKRAWSMFPHLIRIELARKLADAALAHGDKAKALELVQEMQSIIGELNWKAEYRVPLLAHLARQQFLAGDEERAKTTAEQSLTAFKSGRESIVNIYRAGGLRPLAEAYVTIGDADAAHAVYAMAIEEGVVNPNSRPRAEDLCATLCSMAVQGFEPSEALWKRMRDIREGLDHPW